MAEKPFKPRSKKQVIEELKKCAADPIYFIENYAIINTEKHGFIKFKLFQYQKDLIQALLENRFNIVLKARQLGITTVVAAFCAWMMYFHKGRNCLILCTKQETAKNALKMAKRVIQRLPKWMNLTKIVLNNQTSIELSNDSKLKALTTSEDSGRSETASFVFFDEAAHVPNANEIWKGMKPTISTGGRVCVASSPGGIGNFFHATYVKAQTKENNFNCQLGHYVNPYNPAEKYIDRFMWWVRPDHDQEWFEEETRGDSPKDIAQEHLCEFLESGYTFFETDDITKMSKIIREPEGHYTTNKDLWIWEEPIKNESYLISVDVSRGNAEDYSAFPIFKLGSYPLQVVAEYKGKIKPDLLGELLFHVGLLYNAATIAVENNGGWSGQTIKELEDNRYPNVYYASRRKPKRRDSVSVVDPYLAQVSNDYLPGYTVTSMNRNHMLAKLEQAVRAGDLDTRSFRFLEEMKTFIITAGNRPEAMRGYSDDLIMSYCGGLWVRDEAFAWSYKSDESTLAMLDAFSMESTNFQTPGTDINERGRIERHVQEQNKIVMGNGDELSLDWLIG
jgi:hypothetical protein